MFLDSPNEAISMQWSALIGASLLAAVLDLRQGRIPNALTLPLCLTGLVWAVWNGGFFGLVESLVTCSLLGLPYVLLFLFVGGGAGDAKLMGAIGAWLSIREGLIVLVCVIVAGGVLAVAKAISRKRLKYALTSVFITGFAFITSLVSGRASRVAEERVEGETTGELDIPYGVAVFAGVFIAAGIVRFWGVDWIW